MEKGKIVKGQVFSDCLVPVFIDALNEELAKGETTYDVTGMESLCSKVSSKFEGQDAMSQVSEKYIPDLQKWLIASI